MFSVKPLGHQDYRNVPILSGVAFGFIGMPLTFEVKSEKIPTPHFIDFIVSKDASRKPFELHFENSAQDRLQINFYNPSISGPSGLTSPSGFLTLENKYCLGFMFMVDVIGDSTSYRMTYEFYDGLMAMPPEQKK